MEEEKKHLSTLAQKLEAAKITDQSVTIMEQAKLLSEQVITTVLTEGLAKMLS